MVLLAVGTAASPLPVVVVLVVLLTPRAVANGVCFTAGWGSALLALGLGTAGLVGGGARLDEGGALVSALEVLVGLGLLLLAGDQWRRRSRVGGHVLTEWLQRVDTWTARRAFLTGVACLLASPKNLALTVTAAGVTADASGMAGDRILALGAFAALSSTVVAFPVGLRVSLGPRAAGVLLRWRRWVVVHGTRVACGLLVLLGSLLVLRGLT